MQNLKKIQINPRDIFSSRSSIDCSDYVIAKYSVTFPNDRPFEDYAGRLLLETTVGTYTGTNTILVDKNDLEGKSLGYILLSHITNQDKSQTSGLIEVAIPLHICGYYEGIPSLLATLLYISPYDFVRGLRLIDIEFPQNLLKRFKGPRFGVSGIRKILDVEKGPLIGYILKPRNASDVKVYAEHAKEACLGGVNYIIEDELLNDYPKGIALKRVNEVSSMVKSASHKTGRTIGYFTNVTCKQTHARKLIKQASEHYITGFHMNAFTMGFSSVEDLIGVAKKPVLVSKIGRGVLTRSNDYGISPDLLCKLSRYIGGDGVYTGSLDGELAWDRHELMRTTSEIQTQLPFMKRSMAVSSGKTTPSQLFSTIKAHGSDVMLQFDSAFLSSPVGVTKTVGIARTIIQMISESETEADANKELWKIYKKNKDIQTTMDFFGWFSSRNRSEPPGIAEPQLGKWGFSQRAELGLGDPRKH